MPEYFYSFDGQGRTRTRLECDTVEDARNMVVQKLGAHLMEHPRFASEGHWRVDVEDRFGTPLLHVIVATVVAGGAPG